VNIAVHFRERSNLILSCSSEEFPIYMLFSERDKRKRARRERERERKGEGIAKTSDNLF